MAVVEQSRVAPFGSVAVLKVVEAGEGIMRAIRARIAAERAYRALSALSAAQLRDIGLAEHDLADICRTMARQSA